ncbi:hypothetical protein [Dactylosporangium sp. CS-033363]|uniref:hypothetical protein n=1 Tax=Dactylosporangium sp. CS-033363 TaxID=3239935 RepID=UPI003D8EA320
MARAVMRRWALEHAAARAPEYAAARAVMRRWALEHAAARLTTARLTGRDGRRSVPRLAV